MSRLLLLSAVVGVYAVDSAAAQFAAPAQTAFLAMLEDVPLPPGLAEDAGAQALFDGRDGRVMIARAAGEAEASQIAAFYREALPALGWGAADEPLSDGEALVFLRGREKLSLAIEAGDGETSAVRYTLTAAPASSLLD